MISDVERNYEPRKWQKIDGLPPGSRALNGIELLYFCNSDSQRFEDLLTRQRSDKAVLLDYELLSLDLDPTCGSMIRMSPGEKLILTVFTADGPLDFIEV